MSEKFLEISHVSKTFPGVKALSDVSFDIYPGEVHALVGERERRAAESFDDEMNSVDVNCKTEGCQSTASLSSAQKVSAP